MKLSAGLVKGILMQITFQAVLSLNRLSARLVKGQMIPFFRRSSMEYFSGCEKIIIMLTLLSLIWKVTFSILSIVPSSRRHGSYVHHIF